MFERFTERAREVVTQAQAEARDRKHSYIGTEHILVAIPHEDQGVGGKALRDLGLTEERLRQALREIAADGETPITGQIPFTPDARKAMELALREAMSIGHNYIGTEHLVLGLCNGNLSGTADAMMARLEVTGDEVRSQVLRLLYGADKEKREAAAAPDPQGVIAAAMKLRDHDEQLDLTVESRFEGHRLRVRGVSTAADLRTLAEVADEFHLHTAVDDNMVVLFAPGSAL